MKGSEITQTLAITIQRRIVLYTSNSSALRNYASSNNGDKWWVFVS